jgi:hypothetical protein
MLVVAGRRMKILKNRIVKIKPKWNIIFFLVCVIVSCNDPLSNKYQKIFKSHPTITSHTFPDYCSNLFQQNVRGKINWMTSIEHIGRDTVCDFLYDQEYYVALYLLSRSYNFSLQNSLKESFSENSEEFGIPFYENAIHFVGISHRMLVTKDDKPSNIFISFGGSRFSKIEKNDTIADYFFKCKSLSIKYKANGHQEVFVEASDDDPLEIMFLKKEKKLLLIFITPKKDSTSFRHAIGRSLFK